jgi:hypothetical protein
MKILLIFVVVVGLLFGSSDIDKAKALRLKKQIEIEMQKEKRYSQEQTFYFADEYDFKGSEVNLESVKSLKRIEMDDLDMDSVYD